MLSNALKMLQMVSVQKGRKCFELHLHNKKLMPILSLLCISAHTDTLLFWSVLTGKLMGRLLVKWHGEKVG